MTLQDARSILLDNNIVEDATEDYEAGLVLLASAEVGPNVRRVAKWTGIANSRVAEFGRRLRASGIWKGSRVFCNWMDDELGMWELCLDIGVAMGHLDKVEA